jgi:RimJ/RimL family protein N-acetyltransferase
MSIVLETRRLVLREMTEGDAGDLLAMNTNPNVMRFIVGEPPLATIDDARARIRDVVMPQYKLGVGRWACVEKGTGTYVGWSGIKWLEDDRVYDVGYRFHEAHWGKGYGTEAAVGVCDFARRHLVGRRVVGLADPANVASRRILERVGMTYEGLVTRDGLELASYVLPT